jgi:hypothetical protein
MPGPVINAVSRSTVPACARERSARARRTVVGSSRPIGESGRGALPTVARPACVEPREEVACRPPKGTATAVTTKRAQSRDPAVRTTMVPGRVTTALLRCPRHSLLLLSRDLARCVRTFPPPSARQRVFFVTGQLFPDRLRPKPPGRARSVGGERRSPTGGRRCRLPEWLSLPTRWWRSLLPAPACPAPPPGRRCPAMDCSPAASDRASHYRGRRDTPDRPC